MVYFAVLHSKRGEISRGEVISWVIIWSLVIVIIIFPELFREFANTFFVTRVFDLMVIGGFIFVISLVSSAYIRTRRMEKKMEDLVRREALKNVNHKLRETKLQIKRT